ncbi:serine carboxypeptidase [Hortaea werneckii]|nr:serine carboxypeptidase [Hortaea werneckii]KAI7676785.1 serine carboxypeptidase [Hortaea werneckii]
MEREEYAELECEHKAEGRGVGLEERSYAKSSNEKVLTCEIFSHSRWDTQRPYTSITYTRLLLLSTPSSTPPPPLRKLPHPLLQLLNLRINNCFTPLIHLTIPRNKITRMETPRDNQNRHILRTLKRPTRSHFRTNSRLTPWIKPTIRVDETGGVVDEPATGISVNVLFATTLRETVGLPLRARREVQSALSGPVLGGHETGDDGRAVSRGAILPVAEGLVAEHPLPLAVSLVSEGDISKNGAGRVVGVEAVGIECAVEDVSIRRSRIGLFGGRRLRDPDVAPLEEAAVAGVELVALPEPGAVFERGHEVVVVGDVLETEHGFQIVDFVLGPVGEYVIHVIDDQGNVGAAVLRHALLHREEVGPEIVPGSTLSIHAESAPEQLDVVGEVCHVMDGVLEGEVAHVRRGELGERRRGAPVAVFKHNRRSTNLLGHYARSPVGGEIARSRANRDLSSRWYHSNRTVRRYQDQGCYVSPGNKMPAVTSPFVVVAASVAISVVAPEVMLAGDERRAGEDEKRG